MRRLLEHFGAEVRIFDPEGLPLADSAPVDNDKVQKRRRRSEWLEGQVWGRPEGHDIMKAQIDWIPLSLGSARPTLGKTLAIMEVSGGNQSLNADSRMKPSSCYDRVVDVCEELIKFTLLARDASAYLTDRYSERKEGEARDLSIAAVIRQVRSDDFQGWPLRRTQEMYTVGSCCPLPTSISVFLKTAWTRFIAPTVKAGFFPPTNGMQARRRDFTSCEPAKGRSFAAMPIFRGSLSMTSDNYAARRSPKRHSTACLPCMTAISIC